MLKQEIQQILQQLELLLPLEDVSDGLIVSDELWVKFDALAQMEFVKERTRWLVNSVDTLFFDGENETIEKVDFIEFKNQPISNIDKFRLARKGVSSLKVLKILLTTFNLEFNKDLANSYVLVYSRHKSNNKVYATEALHRRRDFYFLEKRLIHQRNLYKKVLIISDSTFIEHYNITTR